MTIQQLEYILAVDQFRHFARAAEYCRVTQPTLSAMIQKLEEELGVKLFDRTVQPVCPTAIGEKIIDQARVILAQTAQVKEIISEEKQSLAGVFRLGVLPTIAPYLLPRFFPQLMEKHPELDIRVTEMKTQDIQQALHAGDLDAAIIASKLEDTFLKEEFEQAGELYISTEDGSVGTKGNVMDAIRENALEADMIYACGPTPMLRAIKQYAEENGIECYISLEERMACGIGACLACVCKSKEKDAHSNVNNKRICKDGPVFLSTEVEI